MAAEDDDVRGRTEPSVRRWKTKVILFLLLLVFVLVSALLTDAFNKAPDYDEAVYLAERIEARRARWLAGAPRSDPAGRRDRDGAGACLLDASAEDGSPDGSRGFGRGAAPSVGSVGGRGVRAVRWAGGAAAGELCKCRRRAPLQRPEVRRDGRWAVDLAGAPGPYRMGSAGVDRVRLLARRCRDRTVRAAGKRQAGHDGEHLCGRSR